MNNENRKIKDVFVDDYSGNLEDIKNAKELGYWEVFLPKQFLPKNNPPLTEEMIRSYPLPKIFCWYLTEIDDPSNEWFKKSGIDISYAADPTSCTLGATCLSLPIDEQSFYLAVRFLQCVKLTEENKFILQTIPLLRTTEFG